MTMKKKYVLIVVVFLLSAGCTKEIKQNPVVLQYTFSKEKWDVADYSTLYAAEKPYIWKDYLVFGNNTRDIDTSTTKGFFIIDKRTGETKLHYPGADTRFVLVGDTVYIGEKTLYALDLNTLQKKWEVNVQNSRFPPAYYDGIVYFITYNNESIRSYDCKTGRNVLTIEKEIRDEIEVNTKDNILYFASKGFYLNAVNLKTGRLRWQKKGEGIIFSRPMLYKNYLRVYGGKRYTVSVLNPLTGELIWEKSKIMILTQLPFPIFHDGNIYTTTTEQLIVMDVATGAVIWKKKNDIFDTLAFQIVNNKLYLPLFHKRRINQYDFDTGEILKKVNLNHKITSPFSYENGIIYYVSEHTLYAEKVEL